MNRWRVLVVLPMVIVRWFDDHHLSISGGGAGTAHLHLTDFRGVRITYD